MDIEECRGENGEGSVLFVVMWNVSPGHQPLIPEDIQHIFGNRVYHIASSLIFLYQNFTNIRI